MEDAASKKWNIKVGKSMFAIKSMIKEEMLQYTKRKKKRLKEAWDTLAMIFFNEE